MKKLFSFILMLLWSSLMFALALIILVVIAFKILIPSILPIDSNYNIFIADQININMNSIKPVKNILVHDANIKIKINEVNTKESKVAGKIHILAKHAQQHTSDSQKSINAIDTDFSFIFSWKENNKYLALNNTKVKATGIQVENAKSHYHVNNIRVASPLINITLANDLSVSTIKSKLQIKGADIKSGIRSISFEGFSSEIDFDNSDITCILDIPVVDYEQTEIKSIRAKIESIQNHDELKFNIGIDEIKHKDINAKDIVLLSNTSANIVNVEALKMKIFNGDVYSNPFEIKNGIYSASVFFNNINLENISNTINISGLNITGIIFGNLNINNHNSEFKIIDGNISDKNNGGTIKYINKVDYKLSHYQQMLSDTLNDFRYSSMQGKISSNEDKIILNLLIKGKNPSFQDGRAIEFNLNIEENWKSLVKYITYESSLMDIH